MHIMNSRNLKQRMIPTLAKRSAMRGFTLTEMLVTLGIVSILASIAVPSYQNVITKTKRAEVKSNLSEGMQLQERFFTLNNRYMPSKLDSTTDPDYYYVQNPFNTTTVYRYYAFARPGSGQYKAELKNGCHVMYVDSIGNREPQKCWQQ